MEKPKKIVQSTEKQVPLNQAKTEDIQIHFGNAELVKIKLLAAINKQLTEVIILLRDKK